MNRPRNRQPRPPQENQRGGSRGGPRGGRGGAHRGGRGAPATPQQAAGTVPTIHQVIPGATVFIILKDDQPTGEETKGVVQDILTRGNHPRGIKVRLRDGQVGRVQRMGDGDPAAIAAATTGSSSSAPMRFSMRYTDVRTDTEFPSEPPPRSLADFMPDLGAGEEQDPAHAEPPTSGAEIVQCPFCSAFEGDEVAVTHHIDREHLT